MKIMGFAWYCLMNIFQSNNIKGGIQFMDKIKISQTKLIDTLRKANWSEEIILAIIIAVKECKDDIEVI